MQAPEVAFLTFGLVLCVGGVAYLAGLLRDAGDGRGVAVAVAAAVAACALALCAANPQVWPLFALSYPSCASVLIEAALRLRDAIGRLPSRRRG